jgi:hypothetical protein
LIQEEVKRRWNSGNGCYHSVQNLLSSRLLYKNVKIINNKTALLPGVLYGCETWSLTLRGEHRLRVFENRVLRRIFRPKRDEVTGGWRKLHNEELHNLYSSPSIIRMIKSRTMKWAGDIVRMENRSAYTIFAEKPEGKRLPGRPRRRRVDNIKMVTGEMGWGCVDWIDLAQNKDQCRALANTVMNLRVP